MLVLDSQSTICVILLPCTILASPHTHPLHITSAKGSQMHESKTAPNNQSIVLTMSELISDDAKKSATRADVMMLAVTTEAELSKLRSWISARFDAIPFKCSPSPSARSESSRHLSPTSFSSLNLVPIQRDDYRYSTIRLTNEPSNSTV